MNENIYKTHELKLINRDSLALSGIKKVINFDNEEFILNSVMGNISVKGNNLELVLLDTDNGDIRIKGKVNSIVYNDSKNEKKESFMTKLFK